MFYLKCYRGADPLKRNVARSGGTGHTKCRINFLPVASIGSPDVAVCDTLPGRTNPDEEIVTSWLEHSGRSGLGVWCSHVVVNSPWIIPGGSSGSGGFVHPLQSKTISNSRVLGYGQLKGHVASIVSIFYQNKFLRKEVCLRGTRWWTLYLRGTEIGKMDADYKDVCKGKIANKTLPKPLDKRISTRETILFWSIFLNRDIDMLINHDVSSIYHG